jgi:hypothetical protein
MKKLLAWWRSYRARARYNDTRLIDAILGDRP